MGTGDAATSRAGGMTDALSPYTERYDDIDSPPQASPSAYSAEPHGHDFYDAIGRKGGNVTKEKYRHNPGHFSAIGEKGGAAMKAKYGSDYFRAMAKARWAKREKSQS